MNDPSLHYLVMFLVCNSFTAYPMLGYILPAAFFCKITPAHAFKTRKTIAVIQAVIIGLISLFSLRYQFSNPDDEDCDAAQSIG